MEKKSMSVLFGLTAALLVAGTPTTYAQAPATNYYAGKTVQMIIGIGPGGGYDLWARTIARHIGKHLPGNPTVVSQNMPGAGSFAAAAHIYNVAAKDGTVMGIIARDATLGPLTGQDGARFDPVKLSWIGTPATETNVCLIHKNAKVKKAEDLFTTEMIIGDAGSGTGTHSYPKALSSLLGMKFKLIGGYSSSADIFLAMERGEVEGICESLDSVHGKRPDWIEKKTVNLLFQGGTEPNEEIKDVPFILKFAKDEETKKLIEFLYAGQGIGRPFIAPPDLPPGVLKMMRDAFNATMKDPEFIAEVKQRKLELAPETGEYLEALIKKIYATPKPIVDKVGALIK
jgi:tripartite-type tricarboxylate transporter receptor subunit TctC